MCLYEVMESIPCLEVMGLVGGALAHLGSSTLVALPPNQATASLIGHLPEFYGTHGLRYCKSKLDEPPGM